MQAIIDRILRIAESLGYVAKREDIVTYEVDEHHTLIMLTTVHTDDGAKPACWCVLPGYFNATWDNEFHLSIPVTMKVELEAIDHGFYYVMEGDALLPQECAKLFIEGVLTTEHIALLSDSYRAACLSVSQRLGHEQKTETT